MFTRSISSTSLALLVCTASATAQAPANDDCIGASAAALGLTVFDSSLATDGTGLALDPVVCDMGTFGDEQIYQDIWFTFAAGSNDTFDIASVNNGNATFDSRLAVYNQSTCPDNPALVIACDDDSGVGNEAMVSVALTMGTTYTIRVGSFSATTAEQPAALSIVVQPPPPPAPANDDCVNATAAMIGLTPFDTTNATDGTGLPLDPLVCDVGPSGDEQIYQDIWFTFTPATTDVYDFASTNNGNIAFDSRIAIYDQSTCPDDPNNVIACNDDDVGLEAGVQSVPLVMGTTYLVRVGSFSATTGEQPAALLIGITPPPPPPALNPANGNHYQAVSAIGISWDDARAAAELTSFMGVQGHLATITDQMENDFIYGSLGGVHRHWVGGFQDLMSPMYSEPGGGWSWITGEPFTFTNWLVGEPNNTGAFPSEDFLELLDDGAFGQTWNDAHPMEHPEGYVIEYPTGTGGGGLCTGDGGDQMGCTDCPCSNNAPVGSGGGCLNSAGTGSRLIATGSTSVTLPAASVDDLRFEATGGPAFQLFILNSGDAIAPTNPANPCFGLDSGAGGLAFDGLRCAVTNTLRNGGRGADANGEVGVTNNPWGGEANPPGGIAVFFGYSAGTTKFFQCIHRDSPAVNCGTGLNTTQAIQVVFTP